MCVLICDYCVIIGTGGQIKNDDDAADIKNMDLSVAHILSGPIAVEGAEPGDAVEVELLDIQPFPERAWGVTAVLDPNNGGGGFLGRFEFCLLL